MELWDVYDAFKQKTGRTHERGVPLNEGDYHIVVHVIIVNDNKEILIQKRQPWKEKPNMWDVSAAGSAITGDSSLAAAIRETKEELGIDLKQENIRYILTNKNWPYFDDVYVVKQNVDIKDLHLQYEEVADAKWSTIDHIRQLIKEERFITYPYIENIFKIL